MLTQGILLNRITNRIRQSLELQQILTDTVQEVRSFLGTDRVKIYRFADDGTGEVIAESVVQHRLPSLLNLHFPAGDIPPHAREMFVKARQRVIVDIPAQLSTVSRLDCPDTTGDLTVAQVKEQAIEEILQRPVDPCHVQYLTAMGVQSSLVIPILHQQQLWGLLVSHHAEARTFTAQELEILQVIADQVAIAISQSYLLSQTREKARRESFINQISTLLHSPLKIQQILQIVLPQVTQAVNGSGGRLYLSSTNQHTPLLYTYGTQPEFQHLHQTTLENHPFWQHINTCIDHTNYLHNLDRLTELITSQHHQPNTANANIQVITDIYQEPSLLELSPCFHPTSIRSLLVMPLHYAGLSLGYLTIFRNEIDTDIIWAGKFDPDERHNRVRHSFDAWRELKLGQAQPWTSAEVNLIHSLGTHLTMAVMQHRLFEYEHEQRLLVEMRNQELHNARTAAEQANRLKSDFLSSTSHELRTPLAATLNYLKLLQEGFYDNEAELKEYINIAYQSTENLVAIINDVLDIAKIEAGRMNLNLKQVHLGSLLENKRNLFSLDSRHKGIALTIESEVETVYADELKLRQILINLLNNAFKFTHTGEVRLRAHKTVDAATPMVKIAVSDTGIGIEPSQCELLFEPFVQAEGSFKRRYGGTGLGLTICKKLVELMGGKIWIDSPGLGQGTTVTFTLLSQNPKL